MTDTTEDDRAAKAREIKQAAHNQWRNDNIEAKRAYEREYYAKNKERRSEEKRRAYASLPPEVKAERMAYQKQWLVDHPEARKEINRRYRQRNKEKIARGARTYSATPENRQRIRVRTAATLEIMAGRPRPEVCEACGGAPDPKRELHFDHCHTSGNFRGWICRECNLALGNVRDNIQRLRQLIAYLERAGVA
jgi:hypothetical protein